MFNQYQPHYYNSEYQTAAPTSSPVPIKMIIFIAIAAIVLIFSIIGLTILLSGKTLTCTQSIGEGENIQTTTLTYEYKSRNLSSGKLHSVYKIEDEFTDEYIDSIKSSVQEEKMYEEFTVTKNSDHQVTIDAKINPQFTNESTGSNYDQTKAYLTEAGMTCK